ncbi:histone H1-like [Forsythia ovata]|uniref:Histone H1-like n=1 Tax=Forsythia ovata TaxID=205694 RepID=A0ABD1SU45_9LAMI
MVKHSYKLPRSAHVPVSGNKTVNVPFDLNSIGSKKMPGRPPKPQPEPVQNDVLVFVHGVQNSMAIVPVSPPNMAVGPGALYVSIGSDNGAVPVVGVGVKRGRGRPAAEVTKKLVLSHLMPVQLQKWVVAEQPENVGKREEKSLDMVVKPSAQEKVKVKVKNDPRLSFLY